MNLLDEKDLQAIAELIGQSESRMKTYTESTVESAIVRSENRMKTYIESNVEKKIQLLAEGHNCILERLPDVDEQAQLKSRVRVLERVVTDMRVELDELKKA